MSKPRRPTRGQHVPVFVGCEGKSEREYVDLLVNAIRQRGLRFKLEIMNLGSGAGDPLSRIQMAASRIKRLERNRSRFERRFVLLDRDQVIGNPAREAETTKLAEEVRITIVWQDPCFEAVLLRHLPNGAARRPASSQIARTDLQKEWADYRKGLPTASLEKRIDIAALTQAATVEPDLGALLLFLKLI